MADVVQTEAIAKAVVRESIDTSGPNRTEAVSLRTIELAEQGHWREALKFGSEPPVSREGVFGRIDQIGAKRNERTGKKERASRGDEAGSSEQQRFNRANDAAELAFRYLEKGYKGLEDDADKSKILGYIELAVKRNPKLAEEFDKIQGDEAKKKAFLERLASDNVIVSEVRAALNKFAQKPDIDDSAAGKEFDYIRLRDEHGVTSSELTDVNRRYEYVKNTLASYDEMNTDHRRFDELRNANSQLPVKESALATAEEEERLAQAALDGKLDERATAIRGGAVATEGVDTKAERERLARAKSGVAKARSDRDAVKDEIARLEQERQMLEQQRRDLEREWHDKSVADGEANLNMLKAQRDWQDALSLRQRQEQDIADSLEGVFTEGAIQMMDKQIDALGEKYAQALQEVEEERTSKDEKAFFAALKNELTMEKARRFGGRTNPRRVINKANVNTYFTKLMKDGDEAFFTEVMSKAIDPETGIEYAPDKIKQLLANREFMEKNSPEAIKRLVAAKEITGGVEQMDVRLIMESGWGKDIISNAAKFNKEFRSQVDSLLGEGLLDQPDFMEKLRREAVNHPNVMAAILAGLVGVTGGAIVGFGIPAVAAAAAGGVAGRAGMGLNAQNRLFG